MHDGCTTAITLVTSDFMGLPFITSVLRGEGVPSKADIVSNLSKGGCMNLRTRGEGVKKSEIFVDIINGIPLFCVLGNC